MCSPTSGTGHSFLYIRYENAGRGRKIVDLNILGGYAILNFV